ncbi:DUF4886 domain-containing protein [Verrucomicrobiota bacterium sgz303538]
MAILLSASVMAEDKVLFIGNSFTIGGTASVPTIFDSLVQAGGRADPTVAMRAVPGTDFQFHSGSATTQTAIDSAEWNYVVLQNFSTEPTHLVDGSHSIADHLKYGTDLYEKVIGSSPHAEVFLFETWSRAAAHPLISGTSGPSSFASTKEMQSELRINYRNLAEVLNSDHPDTTPVQVAPVGDAWENAGALLPQSDPQFVNLFGSDNYHGNDNGYYLAAAVIYSDIYGENPHGLSSSPQVSALHLNLTVDATVLEDVAWNTVNAGRAVPEPSTAALLAAGCMVTICGRKIQVLRG